MDIVPKNWIEFQHYKNRRPPWIKLYRTLLDDVEFHCLPDASKALAIMLWLLASEHQSGIIKADHKALAFRLRTTPLKIKDALKPLIDSGFFVASGVLAGCLQDAIPETERERETEGETDIASRDKSRSAAEPINGNAVIYIPLVGDKAFGVSKEFAAELETLYPAVDCAQTLREIRAWNLANPKNQKTESGIKRHINQWFSKEQNRG